jgi:hypothetical protein
MDAAYVWRHSRFQSAKGHDECPVFIEVFETADRVWHVPDGWVRPLVDESGAVPYPVSLLRVTFLQHGRRPLDGLRPVESLLGHRPHTFAYGYPYIRV